jgi:hypothetical protein
MVVAIKSPQEGPKKEGEKDKRRIVPQSLRSAK